jgi:hypothetical protein
MICVWLWLVMLDMMVSGTWHVPSKVSGRLCGDLGCVSTLVMWLCANPRSYVFFNELILGWETRLHSHSK